jgi:uncharacterized protein (DUF169 family)
MTINQQEKQSNHFEEIASKLTETINLSVPPIAVCFADEIPAGVSNWTGRVPAGCRFWQEATTGVFATTPSDHGLCSIGMYTHNLETTDAENIDRGDSLKVFADLSYVREQDLASIPVLKQRSRYVIYGPLSRMPLAPDVVLLFGKASQMLILSEASQQVEGGLAPAMGRPACAVVPQAFNTGRAALSLGCCGARAYVDLLADDVALWALPGAELNQYLERIVALAQANSVLTTFHEIRREDVEGGRNPTIQESLTAMANRS